MLYFIGIPIFVLAYMAIIKGEENFLSGKFGEEYKQYCGKVNSLIPDLSGFGTTLKCKNYADP